MLLRRSFRSGLKGPNIIFGPLEINGTTLRCFYNHCFLGNTNICIVTNYEGARYLIVRSMQSTALDGIDTLTAFLLN